MKKLDIKAFWSILAGIIGSVIYQVVDLIISRKREFPALVERMDAEKLEKLTTAMFRINVLATVIVVIICAYFIYRLIKNRNEEQSQGYITFLFVINIIGLVLNILSLIFGGLTGLISVAINVLIIVGCAIQRKTST